MTDKMTEHLHLHTSIRARTHVSYHRPAQGRDTCRGALSKTSLHHRPARPTTLFKREGDRRKTKKHQETPRPNAPLPMSLALSTTTGKTAGVFCRCYCVCSWSTPPMWLANPLLNVVGIGNHTISTLQMQLRMYMCVHARASEWRCERADPGVGTDR